MKTNTLYSRKGGAHESAGFHDNRGVALVLVLGFLVLITVLVLAFFSSVTTELAGAKSSSNEASAKLLADSAVQMVMGQIKYATSGTSSSSVIAWASQPGMIRTYDTSGNGVACYKLYSSDNMVVTGSSTFDPGVDLDGQWDAKKALFTDLNSPVTDSTNGLIFPIIDPRALTSSTATSVSGFNYTSNAGTVTIDGVVLPASGAANQRLPMPSKWLYVLGDGTLLAPDASGSNIATFNGAPASKQPSASNPIVGRVAFWSDDETCKVNINTASEGTYWDTPRAYSDYDFQSLSKLQPRHNEFQRYPGHPATTCLTAVFPDTTGATPSPFIESIYDLIPRISGEHSPNSNLTSYQGTQNTSSSGPMTIDQDRLYASVDELLFSPSRNTALLTGSLGISKDVLEQRRFFLTANSRAPDVNLFNKPRICMWPITLQSGTAVMTPLDQVIAFCSTINQKPYYFQRQDPNSSSVDLPVTGGNSGLPRNRSLLDYLRNLTNANIPGFGGNFASKYNTNNDDSTGTDRDQILTEIFDYIRCTNLQDSFVSSTWSGQYTKVLPVPPPNPAVGGTPGTGQVIPIFDSNTGTRGFGRFPTLQEAFFLFIGNGNHGNDSSIPLGKTRVQTGFFMQLFDPSLGLVLNRPYYKVKVSGLDLFSLSDGTTTDTLGFSSGNLETPLPLCINFPKITYHGGVVDFRNLAIKSPSAYSLFGTSPLLVNSNETNTGSGLNTFHFSGGDVTVQLESLDSSGNVKEILQTIALHFAPADIPTPRLDNNYVIGTGTTPGGIVWGTYNTSSFTGSTSPVATTISGRLVNAANSTDTSTQAGAIPPITSFDSVRAVVAKPGDMRLIAARKTIPLATSGNFFNVLYNYIDSTDSWSHMLKTGYGEPYFGACGGKLVNTSYPGYASRYWSATKTQKLAGTATSSTNTISVRMGPINNPNDYMVGWVSNVGTVSCDPSVASAVSSSSNIGVTAAGGIAPDWDNGTANLSDGPYINKADEGDVFTNSYVAYYGLQSNPSNKAPGTTFYSANRLVPSPVILGSLPTGVWADKPWQTLLFRPGPSGHPGLASPPDHLMLDLFNMPVVEPYPISEPLSTAGRVNMNYQIIPYNYILRNTAVRAVLKSEKIISVADAAGTTYKTISNPQLSPPTGAGIVTTRYKMNIEATLAQFQQRFDSTKDIFRSASEICSIDLVPADTTDPIGTSTTAPSRSTMDTYWNTHRLTGDNSRERPYATVYPRLTTKSNTYTVHFRVQTLKKVNSTSGNTWDENRDLVTGEYRGSQVIERYVDASDPTLPDFADPAVTTPIDAFYKFRVLSSKKFTP